MLLQDCITMDIEYLKKIFNKRLEGKYINYGLDEILAKAELLKNDISEYILYPINPLYDYFVDLGITDETEMRRLLATMFYFHIKNESKNLG